LLRWVSILQLHTHTHTHTHSSLRSISPVPQRTHPPLNTQPQFAENPGSAHNLLVSQNQRMVNLITCLETYFQSILRRISSNTILPTHNSNLEGGRPALAPAPLSSSNSTRNEAAHQRLSTNPSEPGSQSTHLRTLTLTAAERKRTVAACRALRAQIARFEDAFIHLHGRAPKGAAERAPLATTYAQYREWNRALRVDAAPRIQALFRGKYIRWMRGRMMILNSSKLGCV